jgi:8-hydroxy-5-deazaflavin:NADPH oxidoreductase
MAADPVPVIGATGALGLGLALRLCAAGVPVVIGSRRRESAEEAAGKVRAAVPEASIEGLENAEAATRGPIVVQSVPFAAQAQTLAALKEVLAPGQILVDATVPLATAVSGKATRTLGVPQGSAAQQAQELVPDGVTVVSALHTVNARDLGDLETELDEDVLVAGDDREATARVRELVELIPGLRAIDCGRLEVARLMEGLTPLLIAINMRNKTRAGIRITGIA